MWFYIYAKLLRHGELYYFSFQGVVSGNVEYQLNNGFKVKMNNPSTPMYHFKKSFLPSCTLNEEDEVYLLCNRKWRNVTQWCNMCDVYLYSNETETTDYITDKKNSNFTKNLMIFRCVYSLNNLAYSCKKCFFLTILLFFICFSTVFKWLVPQTYMYIYFLSSIIDMYFSLPL